MQGSEDRANDVTFMDSQVLQLRAVLDEGSSVAAAEVLRSATAGGEEGESRSVTLL